MLEKARSKTGARQGLMLLTFILFTSSFIKVVVTVVVVVVVVVGGGKNGGGCGSSTLDGCAEERGWCLIGRALL